MSGNVGGSTQEKRRLTALSSLAALTAILVLLVFAATAMAVLPPVAQTPLPGKSIPQFVDPLPTLADLGGPIVAGTDTIQLDMTEFQSKILPTGFAPANGLPYNGTWVWGYRQTGAALDAGRTSYLGPVIIATRGVPTTIKYVNNLGTVDGTNVLAYKNSTDQTLHWADPLNLSMNLGNMSIVTGMPPVAPWNLNYDGPIPATVHLHGGEVPPEIDGGPDSWYTSDGLHHGPGYYTKPGVATEGNSAIYTYPNTGEAAPIWFHDHTLGATRLNVYAGLAGAYLITDPSLALPAGLSAIGLDRGAATGADETIVPLVIQDRMFDTNGELYFPNIGINPEHPYWVPEFLGDTIAVNGKVWPYVNVKAQRYRFLLVNGSNARTYAMSFQVQGKGSKAAPIFWQIGADGGYFDTPAAVQRLVLMPGQRADVIVDFGGLAAGTTMILDNTAKAPYPAGAPVNGQTTGRVMQFRVITGAAASDTSFNPAAVGATIRGGAGQAYVKLADVATGNPTAGVTVDVKRSLTLNEVMGMKMKIGGVQYPGGPLEILVNNTKWSGMSARTYNDFVAVPPPGEVGMTTYYSELPQEGTTEVWEFVNLTADAHPMHLHLVQFQLLNRQSLDVKKYTAAYNAVFPGTPATPMTPVYLPGVYIPGFGPPSNYNTPNAGGFIGGNPDVTPFLLGPPVLPTPEEVGWKDTIMAPPGTVTRIIVRWAPTDLPANSVAANIGYPFDPSGGASYGYVWHCHIVDHEDNEMMRPDRVQANAAVTRTFTDF